jgi:hypothetical protein
MKWPFAHAPPSNGTIVAKSYVTTGPINFGVTGPFGKI